MNDHLCKSIGAAAVAVLLGATASYAAMSTMGSASTTGRTHAHSGFVSANMSVASPTRSRVALTSHRSRTPPGFHHGQKVGWHGAQHPPGWGRGTKTGWHHGTMPPGLQR